MVDLAEPGSVMELRVQNINPRSPYADVVTFIRRGELNGCPISSPQLTLTTLSMCLLPLALLAKGVPQPVLQTTTETSVRLLVEHIRMLCSACGVELSELDIDLLLIRKAEYPQDDVGVKESFFAPLPKSCEEERVIERDLEMDANLVGF